MHHLGTFTHMAQQPRVTEKAAAALAASRQLVMENRYSRDEPDHLLVALLAQEGGIVGMVALGVYGRGSGTLTGAPGALGPPTLGGAGAGGPPGAIGPG